MNRFYLCLLPIFLLNAFENKYAFSATPYVHLTLAEKYLKGKTNVLKNDFLVGTLFPDIRYLGDVSRDETHYEDVGLEDIESESSAFIAGMKLHSFVDRVRENFAVKAGVYKEIEKFETTHKATLLKLVEDEILWNKAKATTYRTIVTNFPTEKVDFEIEKDSIVKWHGFLGNYLQNKPSLQIKYLAQLGKGFLNIPADVVSRWAQDFEKLSKNEKIINYTSEMINNFEKIYNKDLNMDMESTVNRLLFHHAVEKDLSGIESILSQNLTVYKNGESYDFDTFYQYGVKFANDPRAIEILDFKMILQGMEGVTVSFSIKKSTESSIEVEEFLSVFKFENSKIVSIYEISRGRV